MTLAALIVAMIALVGPSPAPHPPPVPAPSTTTVTAAPQTVTQTAVTTAVTTQTQAPKTVTKTVSPPHRKPQNHRERTPGLSPAGMAPIATGAPVAQNDPMPGHISPLGWGLLGTLLLLGALFAIRVGWDS